MYNIPSLLLFLISITPIYSTISLKDKISRTVESALDYAFLSKKISYTDRNDFDIEGDRFVSITLAPGESIKYTCGKLSDRKDEIISLYPEDPVKHTLAPMLKSGINDSIKRVMNNFDIFRSDRNIIHKTMDILGGSYLIQHPYSSVIVSKKLDDFSLNLACIYNSTEDNTNELYRWLEIKFTNVLPLSYGCGSGGYNLFSNVLPNYNITNLFETIDYGSPKCEIIPEPDMIIGIYCGKGDVFDDSCYTGLTNDGELLYDPDFKYMDPNSRLHLFKVPSKGYKNDVNIKCECLDKSGNITSTLKVTKVKEYVCDYKSIADSKKRTPKDQVCRRELRPGDSIRIITPFNGDDVTYGNGLYKSILAPYNQIINLTYIHDIQSNNLIQVKLDSVIAATNFKIEKQNVYDRLEYLISYGKDSILVLKNENTNLTYFWEMHSEFKSIKPYISGTISLGLIPTDPYTFGCGVDYNFIFKDERIDFQQGILNDDIPTKCLLDSRIMSPIGFYCPKDYILDPPNCFRSVFNTNGSIIILNDITKYARFIVGKNLTILDFHPPKGLNDNVQIETVSCNCNSVDGKTLATIQVQIPIETNEEDATFDTMK